MTSEFYRVKFLGLQSLEEFLLSEFFSFPPWLIQDLTTVSYAGIFSLQNLQASNFVCLAHIMNFIIIFIFFNLAVHNVWNKWIIAFLGIGYIFSHLSSFCQGNQSCLKAIFYWFCLFFLRSVSLRDCLSGLLLDCFLFLSPKLACWQTQCFTISWTDFTGQRWPPCHLSWYTWLLHLPVLFSISVSF